MTGFGYMGLMVIFSLTRRSATGTHQERTLIYNCQPHATIRNLCPSESFLRVNLLKYHQLSTAVLAHCSTPWYYHDCECLRQASRVPPIGSWTEHTSPMCLLTSTCAFECRTRDCEYILYIRYSCQRDWTSTESLTEVPLPITPENLTFATNRPGSVEISILVVVIVVIIFTAIFIVVVIYCFKKRMLKWSPSLSSNRMSLPPIPPEVRPDNVYTTQENLKQGAVIPPLDTTEWMTLREVRTIGTSIVSPEYANLEPKASDIPVLSLTGHMASREEAHPEPSATGVSGQSQIPPIGENSVSLSIQDAAGLTTMRTTQSNIGDRTDCIVEYVNTALSCRKRNSSSSKASMDNDIIPTFSESNYIDPRDWVAPVSTVDQGEQSGIDNIVKINYAQSDCESENTFVSYVNLPRSGGDVTT